MPKQNRPLVRDGRLQSKKKRTDRSYLRPDAAPAPVGGAPVAGETVADEAAASAGLAAPSPDGATAQPAATGSARGSGPSPAPPTATAAATGGGRLPTTVRAIQQQGVRKRREFDVHALGVRDTTYALHELRRIFVLASMVIITLVVLWFVLR
ncbi:MAG: hypothetical protein ACYDEB_07270 [Dehalococcoidia bacterium]